MQQKKIYILAFVFLALGLGFLVYKGLNKNSVYFLNVSEALAMGPANIKQARLFGEIQEQGLSREEGLGAIKFKIADKNNPRDTIRVKYAGALPDTFKPGIEVIVEGSMDDSSKIFMAHTLMTKCPSKYKKE